MLIKGLNSLAKDTQPYALENACELYVKLPAIISHRKGTLFWLYIYLWLKYLEQAGWA